MHLRRYYSSKQFARKIKNKFNVIGEEARKGETQYMGVLREACVDRRTDN